MKNFDIKDLEELYFYIMNEQPNSQEQIDRLMEILREFFKKKSDSQPPVIDLELVPLEMIFFKIFKNKYGKDPTDAELEEFINMVLGIETEQDKKERKIQVESQQPSN